MTKYRLLHINTPNGETVQFMDVDTTDPAEDFLVKSRGDTVEFDGIIEADLPMGFPTDHELIRK